MIKVRVPATTANLGPGFDSLGLSLNLYNVVTAEVSENFLIKTTNTSNKVDTTKNNLIYTTIKYFYSQIGRDMPTIQLTQSDCIPISRGLGSSAACIVAGLFIGKELSKSKISNKDILYMANSIEGHPDNVAAAIFGGITVAVNDNGIHISKNTVSKEICFAVFIPSFTLSTTQAREVLPKSYSKEDTIHNISRTALFVSSIINMEWDNLKTASVDKIHQPYRAPLVPGMGEIFSLAYKNGAKCAFLSGAGPSIIAIIMADDAINFETKMHKELQNLKLWQIKILKSDNCGVKARVVEA